MARVVCACTLNTLLYQFTSLGKPSLPPPRFQQFKATHPNSMMIYVRGNQRNRGREGCSDQRYFPPENLDPKSAARFNNSRFCAWPNLIPPLISFSLSKARLLGSSSFSFARADLNDLACSAYNDVDRFSALYSAIRREVSAASRSARSSLLLLEMSS